MEVDSTMTMVPVDRSTGKPRMVLPSPVIFLRKNAYDTNRAHLIIYNWANAATVTVSEHALNGFLQAGDKYRLINVQDYYADQKMGILDGSGLRIAMTGRSVVKPIGYDTATWYNGPPPIKSTFPEFGVFVLEMLGSAHAAWEHFTQGSGSLYIFPQPIQNQATIFIKTSLTGPIEVSIYNVAGRLVSKIKDEKMTTDAKAMLWQSNHIVLGVYTVVVKVADQVVGKQKVIVKK